MVKKDYKRIIRFFDESDKIVLGVSSSIGILALSLVGTIILLLAFPSLKKYSKLTTFFAYMVLSSILFGRGFKSLDSLFKKGFLYSTLFLVIILLIEIISGGLQWSF